MVPIPIDSLTRLLITEDVVRTIVFDLLEDGKSLLNLRATSSTLKHFIEREPERIFDKLYANVPFHHKGYDARALEKVAPLCRHLTLKIGFPDPKPLRKRRGPATLLKAMFKDKHEKALAAQNAVNVELLPSEPSPIPLQDEDIRSMERRLWTFLFKRFTSATTITLRVNGNPSWPGRKEIEASLVILRLALELARPPNLTSIHLIPIHASGIIHLRWTGFGAYYLWDSVPVPGLPEQLWSKITTLNIHHRYPRNVTTSQYLLSMKVLHNYLKSFSSHLRDLRFIWLDTPGPSPLLLDEEVHQPSVYWHSLEQFWFGNITQPHRTLQLITDRAPNIKIIKTLRSSAIEDDKHIIGEDDWFDVNLEDPDFVRRGIGLTASSIYSQSEVGSDDDFHRRSMMSGRSSLVPAPLNVRHGDSLRPPGYVPPRSGWRRFTDSLGRPISSMSSASNMSRLSRVRRAFVQR